MAPKQDGGHIRPASFDAEIGSAEKVQEGTNQFEVFKQGDGVVDFRTVHWIQASVIFLKSIIPRAQISGCTIC